MDDTISAISLRELNYRIGGILRDTSLQGCWIFAEINDLNVRGGHCYLELIEKDENGANIVAKNRGVIWASAYTPLKYKFESVTQQPLTKGLKVMLKASVNFHEQYGLSLVINDINPEFTLGDFARQRLEIIKRLTDMGIIDMNKEIPMPLIPQRIAVISSKTAAGFGDFMNQLHNNSSGIQYYTCLFDARMQGSDTASTIINALNKIYEHHDLFDCVAIIRGGGAVSELNSFDNYELAINIAQFPLPIITGIGHERDNTIADMVANLRLKTPTAVAEWILSKGDDALAHQDELSQKIIDITKEHLNGAKEELSYITSALPHIVQNRIEKGNNRLQRIVSTIPIITENRIKDSSKNLDILKERIQTAISQRIRQETLRISHIGDKISMLSPTNTLKRGYSITRINGKAISHISEIKDGDKISTQVLDGTINSNIISTNTHI